MQVLDAEAIYLELLMINALAAEAVNVPLIESNHAVPQQHILHSRHVMQPLVGADAVALTIHNEGFFASATAYVDEVAGAAGSVLLASVFHWGKALD